ncbi:NAD(P)-dependent oxidoreductase [Mesorhizobium sp. NZP2077]|nr:NAD(P)-dependent oxidoreductase [Mesorhizobium sp. NZP2077]
MLSGRRLAVVGVGEIGASVAKRAKAFDMEVIGVRRHKERPVEYVDHMYGPADLTAILPDCDYVVLATPQTEETQELFGAEEISAMKKGAYLINVGRGGLIKERPLYDALVSEHLGGFATDVWWKYEYGAAFPNGWGSRLNIQKLPNVVLSWHEAHNADDVLERNLELGTQNLRQFLAGQPVCREINLELGY